ncbi:MAG: 1-acyl-sn-glycerol-3-phosphate acyltransferase [Treponema sp.]|nr:1-acyl-sn-glycerol-3-phosphate acyltransferase [Treponema sp.]
MGFRRAAVSFFLKGILNILCKIDYREYFRTLSNNKPMILMINHINFLEVVILTSFGYPFYVTGLAKSETWKNPFFAFLFNTYKAVPINREGAFGDSFKKVCEAVQSGSFVCVAPEGTRSRDGVLSKGKAGIVQLALGGNIAVLPVAHFGGECIWKNIRRLKRTPFNIKTGRPFRIKFDGRPDHEKREEILTEMMIQMARLLPEQMRGIYSHETGNECKYLDFI